jgi:CBS domain containing-hemolysin-like protein
VEGAWPTSDETVGGFIAREAGKVPEPGDEIVVLDLTVEIESVDEGAITSVIVTPPYLEEETQEEDRG